MCRIFGHNYALTSAFGNYAFCSKCGHTLTIKDPYVLTPGERRYMHGTLMEMTEFGLEEVKKDVKETSREVYSEESNTQSSEQTGEYSIQSTDPGERY